MAYLAGVTGRIEFGAEFGAAGKVAALIPVVAWLVGLEKIEKEGGGLPRLNESRGAACRRPRRRRESPLVW
eukprot:SAG31_NODE_4593_length_3107_cov_5.701463_3_plen_71_part_00